MLSKYLLSKSCFCQFVHFLLSIYYLPAKICPSPTLYLANAFTLYRVITFSAFLMFTTKDINPTIHSIVAQLFFRYVSRYTAWLYLDTAVGYI